MEIPTIDIYYPQKLSLPRYDRFLAAGWFRAATYLYRSQLFCIDGQVASVVNIRVKLNEFSFSSSQRKLMNRNKKRFRHVIKNHVTIDNAREYLYQQTKYRFRGYVFPSLIAYFQYTYTSPFDTFELSIYDGDKLVAVSFFDPTNHSSASLLALHDSQYTKYSLGYYSLLLEIENALSNEKKFFYPGYAFDVATLFDYKYRLDALEYYNWKGKWRNYAKYFAQENTRAMLLRQHFELAETTLKNRNINYCKYLYPLFLMSYNDAFSAALRSPIFFLLLDHPTPTLLAYDIEKNVFIIGKAYMASEDENNRYFESIPYVDNTKDASYRLELVEMTNIFIADKSIEKVLDFTYKV